MNETDGVAAEPSVPRHVAIVMDGNGRWARKRFMPRVYGHKVGVFALVLVRFWWRMKHPPPEVPMPPFQASIAHYVHLLIYELLIINDIAGTAGWIASGDPIVFFGMPLAGARTASPDLNHLCIVVGLTTARILIVMIALHILAVVKHEWFDRDRLLARMLPGPAILLPLKPGEIVRRMRERRRRLREQRASRES